MEAEMQGCHEDGDSLMTRLSVVSLKEESEAPHHHHHLQSKTFRYVICPATEVSDVNRPTATALGPHATMLEVSNVPYYQQEAVEEEEMQAVDGPCAWAEMLPDALVKIFSHLSLHDMLCTIPCVCRTWHCVSRDAPCWHSVDLSEWSLDKQPKTIERMLLLVMNRSQAGLQEICAPNLSNDRMLRIIACSGSQLQVLRIPNSFVSEECIGELAPKLSLLNYLDISGRYPSKALLESFGKHCHFITRLNLNMRLNVRNTKSCDVAALAVAQNMPQLKHLEMQYGLLSNIGFKALLENCRSLEYLDLRGCWHVSMEESLTLDASKRIKVFFSPAVENNICDTSDVTYIYNPESVSEYYDYSYYEYYDYSYHERDFQNMYEDGFEDLNGQEVCIHEEYGREVSMLEEFDEKVCMLEGIDGDFLL